MANIGIWDGADESYEKWASDFEILAHMLRFIVF